MKNIKSVYFNEFGFSFLGNLLQEKNYSKIFILVDENTNQFCLSLFLSELATETSIEVIEIEAGEEFKNIETCTQVWYALSELGADRKSLIINLGGGVVTDLGGFVASTYMRGVDFVNVPTTLLAMVDASVGGKTGVDLGALKNQIGLINNPLLVIIDSRFLATLPAEQLRSGMAEMFKHGLIQSESYWGKMLNLSNLTLDDLDALIYESVLIKNNVVEQDPTEKSLRKTLNFGHTLGHAIESYCLQNTDRQTLLHGEAIAIGMVLAGFLSVEKLNFPKEKCFEIKETLSQYFEKQYFKQEEIEEIVNLMKFDKKNSHGNINFVLLEDIAKPKLDCLIEKELIYRAFNYYMG
ncbi:3-dehydroquinate synthase [Capnocytophaga stomatis]|uniref:3-dehydroquinate synthase n=1 Tax=Capnocytophaga stomatis TaxID=1848904 RepID=A0ABW8Q910_9FLAO|nr:3-dehydroquinate synthase [Capnocytophaga stomatis]GIJ93094.1 3-dehydroquinate synthase [Capnocytophaga stomatis]